MRMTKEAVACLPMPTVVLAEPESEWYLAVFDMASQIHHRVAAKEYPAWQIDSMGEVTIRPFQTWEELEAAGLVEGIRGACEMYFNSPDMGVVYVARDIHFKKPTDMGMPSREVA